MHVVSLDGRIIAAGTCVPTDHGLHLHGGATHPDVRGRGAYRALLAARWAEAVNRGTPVLLTQGGSQSLPILERAGFEPVGHVHMLVDRFDADPKNDGRARTGACPAGSSIPPTQLARSGWKKYPAAAVFKPACTGALLCSITPGGVAERLNAPVLKTGNGRQGHSWVRIPPPPLARSLASPSGGTWVTRYHRKTRVPVV